MKNDITIKNSSMDVYDYCEKNGISLAKIEENIGVQGVQTR